MTFAGDSSHHGADAGGGRRHSLQVRLLRRHRLPDAVVAAVPRVGDACDGRRLLRGAVVPSRTIPNAPTSG